MGIRSTFHSPVRLTMACAIALACAAPAHAKDPVYVAPEEVHASHFLATPAALQSAVWKTEIAELHHYEEVRTAEQAARAQWDDANENMFLFQPQIGAWFNAQNLPAVATLSAHVKTDEGVNSGPVKQAFARVRPYNADATLHPVCKTKTLQDSYPSGHASSGYLLALALIDVMPEWRDAVLARAADYANNRLVCGVHYRSDVQASQLLAYAVHAVMATKPAYQADVQAARSAVLAALASGSKVAFNAPQ